MSTKSSRDFRHIYLGDYFSELQGDNGKLLKREAVNFHNSNSSPG
jgi:hypothetical protein